VTDAITLEPTAVYDDGALYCLLGLSAAALAKARRSRRLRYTRQGNRTLYLGEWIVEWLRSEGQAESECHRGEPPCKALAAGDAERGGGEHVADTE
jgi:hypothetical protein